MKQPHSGCRGTTVAEVLIASALCALILCFLMALTITSARTLDRRSGRLDDARASLRPAVSDVESSRSPRSTRFDSTYRIGVMVRGTNAVVRP